MRQVMLATLLLSIYFLLGEVLSGDGMVTYQRLALKQQVLEGFRV